MVIASRQLKCESVARVGVVHGFRPLTRVATSWPALDVCASTRGRVPLARLCSTSAMEGHELSFVFLDWAVADGAIVSAVDEGLIAGFPA